MPTTPSRGATRSRNGGASKGALPPGFFLEGGREKREATRMIEKRREMLDVQSALQSRKVEFRQRCGNVSRRADVLSQKSVTLQEQLLNFNKIAVDKDQRRVATERKAAAERKIRLRKEKDVRELHDNLRVQQKKCVERSEQVMANVRFREFLNRVCDASEEFNEVRDIIARHATLKVTNSSLMEGIKELQVQHLELKQHLARVLEDRTNEMLSTNSRIAELQATLEAAQRRTSSAQAALEYSLNSAGGQQRELGTIQMACENLYLRVLKPRHSARARVLLDSAALDSLSPNQRATSQLAVLKDHMEDLISIVEG